MIINLIIIIISDVFRVWLLELSYHNPRGERNFCELIVETLEIYNNMSLAKQC